MVIACMPGMSTMWKTFAKELQGVSIRALCWFGYPIFSHVGTNPIPFCVDI
jgi:hypothetical protein